MGTAEAIVRLITLPFELAFTIVMVAINAGVFAASCAILLVPVALLAFLGFVAFLSAL